MNETKAMLYHIEEMAVNALMDWLDAKVPKPFKPEPVTEYWTEEDNNRVLEASEQEREVWFQVIELIYNYSKELEEVHAIKLERNYE